MVQNSANACEMPEEEEVDIERAIKENMGNGKRHFLCNDYPAAVACFEEACSLLSEKYGQTAEECSDAYYYYGVSLLEHARLENGVLGNALKGVPDEEESDRDEEQFEKPNLKEKERLELRETVVAAMATKDEEESGEDKEQQETASSTSGKDDSDEVSSEKKEDAEEKSAEGEGDSGIKLAEDDEVQEKSDEVDQPEASEKPCSSKSQETEEEQDTMEEDPEDISNMQLAWEMLELAKVLYKKKEANESNTMMVAQCHLKLGELSLEVENYSQAIDDFLECLKLQKESLSGTDRKLAETHYNLGLAYTFNGKFNDANEHYKNSLKVLEARVELLENQISSKKEENDEAEILTECREVGEIKELIPDINSKIEDVLGMMKNQSPSRRSGGSSSMQSKGETTIGFAGSSSSSSSPSCSTIQVKKVSPKPVVKDAASDINHLVRRKRPCPDEDLVPGDGSGDCKKAKQECDLESKSGTHERADTESSEVSPMKKDVGNGDGKPPMKDEVDSSIKAEEQVSTEQHATLQT